MLGCQSLNCFGDSLPGPMAPRSLFKDYGDGKKQRRRIVDDNLMEQTTLQCLSSMMDNSMFFRDNPPRNLAFFQPQELILDKIVGMGEFGIVLEVVGVRYQSTEARTTSNEVPDAGRAFFTTEKGDVGIGCPTGTKSFVASDSYSLRGSQSCTALNTMSNRNSSRKLATPAPSIHSDADSGLSMEQQKQNSLRDFICAHVHQSSSSGLDNSCASTKTVKFRYVVKQLRKDLYMKKKLEASKDLAREAKFLASCEHANIIKLRGIVSNPGRWNFMIILDHLQETLAEAMVEWKEQDVVPSMLFLPWSTRIEQQQNTVSSMRLMALYDVAQAVQYLHHKG